MSDRQEIRILSAIQAATGMIVAAVWTTADSHRWFAAFWIVVAAWGVLGVFVTRPPSSTEDTNQ